MLTEFSDMPKESKVWIFQATANLSKQQVSTLQSQLATFLETWEAHGKALRTACKISSNRFIIIAADESYHLASGCSIDKLIHFIKQLENQLAINLLDRSHIAIQNDDQLETYPLNSLSAVIKEGKVKQQSILFNNAIENIKDLETRWKQPIGASWASKYFNK